MIPLIVGIIFLFGLFLFIYFVQLKKTENIEISPLQIEEFLNPNDIVLAQLTEEDEITYALLWNYKAGETFHYTIKDNETDFITAEGDLFSQSAIYKVKGVPLQYGHTYSVSIGQSNVIIHFQPPLIDTSSIVIEDTLIEAQTDIMPSNIEVLISGVKLSNSLCNVRLEPPGFICYPEKISGEVVVMVYNGENTANIYVKHINAEIGITPL